MAMAVDGGAGATLSEIYQNSKKVLLRARDGIERLERLETSTPSGGFDSPELSFAVKKDLSQIQSLRAHMDRLWRSIAAKAQRDLWKRKVEQVAVEAEALKQSLDKYAARKQRRMKEAQERAELLGRANGETSHVLRISDEEAQAMQSVHNSKRMLAESLSTGAAKLSKYSEQRERLKNMEFTLDDSPVPDADLLPNREAHCSMTGIYAQDPLVNVDVSSASMSRIPNDFLSADHPIGALIAPTGLHFLRTIDSSRTPHKELLSALAERWWPSTDTFHFAWGEMTMTPANFSAISGIPFGSHPLQVYTDWRQAISSAQMVDLIGIDLPRGKLCVARTVLVASAQTIYDGYRAGTISVDQAARFTIILLIAATFYTNKKQAVNPGIVKSLVDLSFIGEYDWAGAMLCRLYEDMSDLSQHHIRVCSISYFWEVWAYEYFPRLAPILIDSSASYFPVSWRWFSHRIHDRSLELLDRRSITALRTFFDTANVAEVTPDVFFSFLSSRAQEDPKFLCSIQRTSMRFLLPHPFYRRYYLGERVTFQYIHEFIVPKDPPFDMLSGDSMIVTDGHYRGTDHSSLVYYDMDYASFRATRLMPPIGDRFKSAQRRPRTALQGSSHRVSTGRGGGRSSPDTCSVDSSGVGSSCPTLQPSGRPHPPRPGIGTSGHLRVPPSISEASGPVDILLAGVRLPYELAYGVGNISYFQIPVEEPDRSLPIARVTKVPEGYIQDLLDFIDGISLAFSNKLSIYESDRAEKSRKRPRR